MRKILGIILNIAIAIIVIIILVVIYGLVQTQILEHEYPNLFRVHCIASGNWKHERNSA